jgi:DNA polymerase-3 subunit epsilon
VSIASRSSSAFRSVVPNTIKEYIMDKLASAGRTDAAGDEKTRVLHRLDVREGPTGAGNGSETRVGVAVDVETTSTIVAIGAIIELAVRSFHFDRDGIITHIGPIRSWREDPGVPLTSETTAITGLTDADVAGERIDEAEATRVLRSASLVVAHHAAFDRPYVERRLEEARGLDWACSFRQIDWRARGFDGRTLGYSQGADAFTQRLLALVVASNHDGSA